MRSLFTRAGLIALAILGLLCFRLSAVSSQIHLTESPAWTTDLRKLGFNSDELNAPALFQSTRQIAFGNSDELVVAGDSGPFVKPNLVHAFVLDGKNGKVLRETNWTSGSWPFIFATSSGKYAVVTENGMALYSAGLQQVITKGTHVADKSSPDGRYLAASESIPGHGVTIFIDAETLKPTGTEFRDTYVWSLAENRVAYYGLRDGNAIVLLKDKNKQVPDYPTDCKAVRPNFITTDLLAVLGCEKLDVVSVSKGKIFSAPLEGADSFFAASSRDGKRFAVIQHFESAGDPPRMRAERITVFDVSQQKPICVTNLADLKGFTAGKSSGVALSPDGSRLAINSAGVVRLFALKVE